MEYNSIGIVCVKNWHNIVMKKLNALFQSGKFCDTILCFPNFDTEIEAHSLILKSCSIYFVDLFESVNTNYQSKCRLDMPSEITPTYVLKLINFMYCGKLDLSNISIDVLLETAKVFKMTSFINHFRKIQNSSDKASVGVANLYKDMTVLEVVDEANRSNIHSANDTSENELKSVLVGNEYKVSCQLKLKDIQLLGKNKVGSSPEDLPISQSQIVSNEQNNDEVKNQISNNVESKFDILSFEYAKSPKNVEKLDHPIMDVDGYISVKKSGNAKKYCNRTRKKSGLKSSEMEKECVLAKKAENFSDEKRKDISSFANLKSSSCKNSSAEIIGVYLHEKVDENDQEIVEDKSGKHPILMSHQEKNVDCSKSMSECNKKSIVKNFANNCLFDVKNHSVDSIHFKPESKILSVEPKIQKVVKNISEKNMSENMEIITHSCRSNKLNGDPFLITTSYKSFKDIEKTKNGVDETISPRKHIVGTAETHHNNAENSALNMCTTDQNLSNTIVDHSSNYLKIRTNQENISYDDVIQSDLVAEVMKKYPKKFLNKKSVKLKIQSKDKNGHNKVSVILVKPSMAKEDKNVANPSKLAERSQHSATCEIEKNTKKVVSEIWSPDNQQKFTKDALFQKYNTIQNMVDNHKETRLLHSERLDCFTDSDISLSQALSRGQKNTKEGKQCIGNTELNLDHHVVNYSSDSSVLSKFDHSLMDINGDINVMKSNNAKSYCIKLRKNSNFLNSKEKSKCIYSKKRKMEDTVHKKRKDSILSPYQILNCNKNSAKVVGIYLPEKNSENNQKIIKDSQAKYSVLRYPKKYVDYTEAMTKSKKRNKFSIDNNFKDDSADSTQMVSEIVLVKPLVQECTKHVANEINIHSKDNKSVNALLLSKTTDYSSENSKNLSDSGIEKNFVNTAKKCKNNLDLGLSPLFSVDLSDKSNDKSVNQVKTLYDPDLGLLNIAGGQSSNELNLGTNLTGSSDEGNMQSILTKVIKKYPDIFINEKNLNQKISSKETEYQKSSVTLEEATGSKNDRKFKKSTQLIKNSKGFDTLSIISSEESCRSRDSNIWVCEICPLNDQNKFSEYISFQKHMHTVHNMAIDANRCEYCGEYNSVKTELYYHKLLVHNISPPSVVKFPKCNQCFFVAINQKMLTSHLLNHSNDRNYLCSLWKSSGQRRKQVLYSKPRTLK